MKARIIENNSLTKLPYPKLMRGINTGSIYLVPSYKNNSIQANCILLYSGDGLSSIGEISKQEWRFLEDFYGKLELGN